MINPAKEIDANLNIFHLNFISHLVGYESKECQHLTRINKIDPSNLSNLILINFALIMRWEKVFSYFKQFHD